MRITNLTSSIQQDILVAWKASIPKMFDGERTLESLVIPLAEETNTIWYSLPNGNFMLFRNTILGGSANLQFLTVREETIPELEAARDQLVSAMKEFRLKRINVTYPTVLAWRDFKLLGFKHEGRIRRSVLFDGEWIDAEILGALENEIGISRRRRRKRYRTKKEHVNARRSTKIIARSTATGTRSEGSVFSSGDSVGDVAGAGSSIES